jgi:hypothetical protein
MDGSGGVQVQMTNNTQMPRFKEIQMKGKPVKLKYCFTVSAFSAADSRQILILKRICGWGSYQRSLHSILVSRFLTKGFRSYLGLLTSWLVVKLRACPYLAKGHTI